MSENDKETGSNTEETEYTEDFTAVDIDISEELHDAIVYKWMLENLDEASLYHYQRLVDNPNATHRGLSKAEALYEAIFNMESQQLLIDKISKIATTPPTFEDFAK